MYPDGKQVFQQDGAPAHTLISMQQFVESNMSMHRSKAVWLLYLLDPNRDYGS
jgi:hypothetical protein